MNIKKITNEPIIKIIIEGSINSDNYHDFEKEMLSLNYNDTTIILDFKNVPYITSAAIRVLLIARKNIEKEKLIIINANKEVKEIIESSGFTDMLTFKDEEDNNPSHKSFKTLLKDVVSLYPDKEAYIMGSDRYTWKDIDKCSQIIAFDLSKLGIKKGSHVGLISMNSINWLCTFFAIQKLGGIVCSLNFNSKEDEVILLSNIADIEFLCYGLVSAIENPEEFFNNRLLKETKIKNIYNIKKDIDFRKRYNEYDNIKDKFTDIMHADDPSLIIFTSGSTGTPKVVLSSSFNRISVFYYTCKQDNFTPDENTISCIYLPLFHLFGIMHAIIIPLINHATICLSTSPKIDVVLDTIYKEKCTLFPTVPTFISAMTSYEGFKSEMVDSIEYILFGGEPITIAQVKNCNEKFKNAKISNGYGLSEISPISKTLAADTFEHLTKTVGKVYDVIDIKIVDINTNKILPIGEIGEICVKADSMMIGYYKLDINSQAIDNNGYIKTGDLGYMREDGYLALTGRCKELIIRSGENISPNEITNALSTYEDIAQVKVYGVPDEKNGEAVAAAIIMKKGKTLDKEKLNTYLSDKIANFKIPKYYIEFESFPLLSNNKLDGVSIKKEMIKRLGLSK